MSMPFHFLPNTATADVAFEASGKTLNEVFSQSCLATSSVMVDLKSINSDSSKEFSKKHKTLEGLLFDVLDEIVYLKDAENLLFSSFSVKVKEGKGGAPNSAQVIAKGQKINQKSMALRNDIKAITWHLFSLKKRKKGNNRWMVRVLVDV